VGDAAVALIALNEEPAIDGVVRDFAAVRQVRKVIVVDNMSSDRTAEIAARAGAHVVKELRRGYGFACQRALREAVAANQPVVILCEADGTFRAADIEKLVVYLRHSDVVIGSRTHSALLDGESQLNSFFILGNLFVAKLLQARYWDWTLGGRVRLTDVGCTYVAIRAEALRRILPSLEVGSNHFIPHFLMVALEHGLRVVQVPVTFWKRVGISKGGNANWWAGFRLGLLMIWHILTYRVKSNAITVPAEEFGSS
jgi:glycosyltransferase involved in cell wall biosynthesis